MSAKQSTVEYRDIPGFPGYRVGDDGSVWSRRKQGSYARGLSDTWHRLSPNADSRGYHRIHLYRSLGKRSAVRRLVHHLILESFVGPCPEGMECCHDDGNPGNNALVNLRWDTQQGNWADRIRHGNDCRGEKNAKAKLTVSSVRFIRANADRFSRRELAKRFDVTRQLITLVINRKCWAWLE